MRRRARIDQRGSCLILSSYSVTAAGFFILNDTMRVVAADTDGQQLGLLVLQMLDACRGPVPTPSRDDYPLPSLTALLALAGVRSLGQYHENCLSVHANHVEQDAGFVSIHPSRNLGSRGGFEEMPGVSIRVELSDPTALGAAVREGLTRCR